MMKYKDMPTAHLTHLRAARMRELNKVSETGDSKEILNLLNDIAELDLEIDKRFQRC